MKAKNDNPQINNIPEQKPTKILTPFKLQIIQSFPFIEADFDAITNEQLLQKVVDYLNKVIENSNNVTENTTNLYNAFVELENFVNDYFDNLDVQDEINNKIDDMVTSGKFSEIVGKYIDPYFDEFNNRLDMQDIKINAVENGSPLVASSTSQMTNTSKVYVNTSDGKWYYYNGSSWVAGGIYQSTGIADNSVLSNNINGGINLVENVKFDLNTFINYQGTIVSRYNTDYSDYIRVREDNGNLIYNDLYFSIAPPNLAYVVFYNKDKNYVSNLGTGQDTVQTNVHLTFDNKPNAYYIRVPRFNDYTNNLIVSNMPIKNLNWLQLNSNNVMPLIESGIDFLKDLTYEENTFIDYQGNPTIRNNTNFFDFIKIRNDNGTLIYNDLYFSIAPPNLAYVVFYDNNKNFLSYKGTGQDTVQTNVHLNFNNYTNSYYIRIPWFLNYPTLVVSDKPIKTLNWLQVTLDNIRGLKFNDEFIYKKERPENGEVHFTVNIKRKINNVEDDYVDTCVLFLPENYKPSGKKTRLIISCHGSGTVIDDNFHINSKTWNKFFYDMGYAIMDCNGGVPDGRHYGAPFCLSSYIKAYQYVIENYNLYDEVFLLGASMGGLSSFNLINNSNIPILAQAGFCTVVDHYKSAWCYPWYSEDSDYSVQRKAIARYFNFDNYDSFNNWTPNRTSSTLENDYYLENIDKIYGFNPIIKNNINWKEKNIYTNNSSDTNDYDGCVISRKIPLKLWQAENDNIVLTKYNSYLKDFINNGGSFCNFHIYDGNVHTPGWGEKQTIKNYNNKDVIGFNNEVECYYFFHNFEL